MLDVSEDESQPFCIGGLECGDVNIPKSNISSRLVLVLSYVTMIMIDGQQTYFEFQAAQSLELCCFVWPAEEQATPTSLQT